MGHLPTLIQDLALILIAGALIALIFRRINQPVVLGVAHLNVGQVGQINAEVGQSRGASGLLQRLAVGALGAGAGRRAGLGSRSRHRAVIVDVIGGVDVIDTVAVAVGRTE